MVIITNKCIAGYANASAKCQTNNDEKEKFSKGTMSIKNPLTCNITTISVAIIFSISIPNLLS